MNIIVSHFNSLYILTTGFEILLNSFKPFQGQIYCNESWLQHKVFWTTNVTNHAYLKFINTGKVFTFIYLKINTD
jgi:hypothetical protein